MPPPGDKNIGLDRWGDLSCMPNHLISVIVVNLNGKDYIAECLHSLLQQTLHDWEIIVVDNDSKDGSVEYLQSNFGKSLRLLCNRRNEGFSAGRLQWEKATTKRS